MRPKIGVVLPYATSYCVGERHAFGNTNGVHRATTILHGGAHVGNKWHGAPPRNFFVVWESVMPPKSCASRHLVCQFFLALPEALKPNSKTKTLLKIILN